jgi:hypothetical protein
MASIARRYAGDWTAAATSEDRFRGVGKLWARTVKLMTLKLMTVKLIMNRVSVAQWTNLI